MPNISCTFDGVTLSSASFSISTGPYPGTGTIVFPSYDEVPEKIGTLVLSDGINTLVLTDMYTINPQQVRDSTTGQEVSCTISDRRYTWKWGYITGTHNQVTADVTSPTDFTLSELIDKCFTALDETNYVQIDTPLVYPAVEWEYENPAAALSDLCDKFGLSIGYSVYDNAIIIAPIDYNRALPTNYFSREKIAQHDDILPNEVIVVGGRRVHQETFHKLVPLGQEVDGTIVHADNLSYKPSGGWEESIVKLFSNVIGEEEQALANKMIFKWYGVDWTSANLDILSSQVTVFDKENILPFLNQLCEAVPIQGKMEYKAPFIEGTITEWDGMKFVKNPHGLIKDGYTLDKKLGIVKFNKPKYEVEAETPFATSFNFPSDLSLTVAFEQNNGNNLDFETWSIQITGGTELPAVLTEPSLIPFYVGAAEIPLNAAPIDAYADVLLDNAKRQYQAQQAEEVTYVSVELEGPYGAIVNATYSVDPSTGAETVLQKYREVPKLHMPPYKERLRQKAIDNRVLGTKSNEEAERQKAGREGMGYQKLLGAEAETKDNFSWMEKQALGKGINKGSTNLPALSVAQILGYDEVLGLWNIKEPASDSISNLVYVREAIPIGEQGGVTVDGIGVVEIHPDDEADISVGDTVGTKANSPKLKKDANGNMIVLHKGQSPRSIYVKSTGGGGSQGGGLHRAKSQEDLGGNTDTLSVKLIDAAGATPDDPFDVYIVAGKGAVDTDDYAPEIKNNDVVFVAQIHSEWYLIPGLLALDPCEDE